MFTTLIKMVALTIKRIAVSFVEVCWARVWLDSLPKTQMLRMFGFVVEKNRLPSLKSALMNIFCFLFVSHIHDSTLLL